MMKNGLHIVASQTAPLAEEKGWSGLYARICELALAKAASMAGDAAEDEERFDRSARALRTLMSAADIARRLKNQDVEEKDTHALNAPPAVSDARIRHLKARLEDQIARLEQEECASSGNGDAS